MRNSREIAISALIKMEKDDGYSNLVIKSLLEKENAPKEEKALATRIFYGVIEKKKILDYNISKLSSKPTAKLDIEVLQILRMGLYQLFYMDTIPESAVVNECVKLCDFTKKSSAKSFVNAILRNKIRDAKKLLLPKENSNEYLSTLLSADKSIVSLFEKQYGREKTISIFSAFDSETPQYIRVNNKKITDEALIEKLKKSGFESEKIMDGCLEIKTKGNLTKLSEFRDGEFFVQDKASQLCTICLECENAKRILDVCSAPGGKSFAAAILSNDAEIISCDLTKNRLSLIDEGKKRLGFSNVKTKIQDASEYNPKLGKFDRVLCDLVCSGLGVIGKKPEIKYKKINPNELWDIQNKILETSAKYVDDGGILIYSTCTLNKKENEEVVHNFLEKHNEFEPYPLVITERTKHYKTLFPDTDRCDGFFISAVKRKGNKND